MKLKSLVAGVLAVTVVLGSSMSAFAAGSASGRPNAVPPAAPAAQQSTTQPAQQQAAPAAYEAVALDENSQDFQAIANQFPEVTNLIKDVNKGEVDSEGFVAFVQGMLSDAQAANDTEAAEELQKFLDAMKDKDFVSPFFLLKWQNGANKDQFKVTRNNKDFYKFTLNVPALTDKLTGVGLVVLNADKKAFQFAPATNIDNAKKNMDVEVESVGLAAVVADADSMGN